MSAPSGRQRRSALAWGLGATGLAVLAATLVLAPRAPTAPPPASTETPASSTAPTTAPTASPQAVLPGASGAPRRSVIDHQLIYLPRTGLPPIGLHVDNIATQATPEDRIRSRLDTLNPVLLGPAGLGSSGPALPQLAFNPFPAADPKDLHVSTVAIAGDTATIDFLLPLRTFDVSTTEQATGLVQELVYTATEETGIRRARITANGGAQASAGGFLINTSAMSRDDVVGYRTEAVRTSISMQGDATGPLDLTARWSVEEIAPALARLTVETGITTGPVPGAAPSFIAEIRANDETTDPDLGKWVLRLRVIGARPLPVGSGSQSGTTVETRKVDQTPLRSVRTTRSSSTSTIDYELGLDDLRPWRVALAFSPVRILVDVGGAPQAINTSLTVYTPTAAFGPNTYSRDFELSGLARTFEGNVQWRLRDARDAVVVKGVTTASLGTSAAWGAYQTRVRVPDAVTGPATLEIFEVSAKDGTELNTIRVPIVVR